MDFLLFLYGLVTFVRGQRVRSVLIAILLATNVFGTVKVMSIPFHHEMGDLGLMQFIFMACMHRRYYRTPMPDTRLLSVLVAFAAFLLLSVTVDVMVMHRPVGDMLLTSRRFYLFAAAYPIMALRKDEVWQLLRMLTVANMVVMGLTALQYVGVISFLSYNFENYSDKNFLGFYSPSSLMPAALLLLSPAGKQMFPRRRNVMLAVCVVAILLTVIRSYIFSFGVGMMIVLFFSQGINRTRLWLLAVVVVVVWLGFEQLPQLGNRFGEVEHSVREGSMDYRMGVLAAAVQDVGRNAHTMLLGVGWRNVPTMHTLSDVVLATPDISWAPMLGRLGYGGSVLFLGIYAELVRQSIKKRHSPLGPLALALVVHVLMCSWAGSLMMHGRTLLVSYLLYSYLHKE